MERYDFKTQRLYVDCALTQQTRVKADRAQANYLLNVLRMKPGDPILLFNGRDGEWLAHVTVEGKKNCTLACDRQVRVQPDAPTLHYLFAPLKQGRLDYLIQKAVEMGAGILQPVLTQYTQVTKLQRAPHQGKCHRSGRTMWHSLSPRGPDAGETSPIAGRLGSGSNPDLLR